MDVEINLNVLLRSLLKHLWIIVIVTLLVTLVTAVYTVFMVTPMYSATTTARVMVTDLNSTTGSNLQTTINLMDAYVKSITSDETMEYASARIDNEAYTPERIRSMIRVGYEEGSIIISITATGPDANNASIIANVVRKAAEHTLDNMASLTTINEAKPPQSPTSPSLFRNIIIAFLAGAVLSYLICLLIDLNNTKITSEEQVSQALNVPVIGVIPLFQPEAPEIGKGAPAKGGVKQ